MKGSFVVQGIDDLPLLGVALRGHVAEGSLSVGMEAQHGGTVVIIREMISMAKGKKPLSVAKKRQKVWLIPMTTVLELLRQLEGATLEFEDVRSIPVKGTLVLDPEPIV